MQKILLFLIIILCIGGIVGAAYTYNEYSEALENMTDETEEPTEDPSACKHKEEIVLEAVAATCYKTGYTEGRKCKSCGAILIEQEIIEKTAHTPVVIPSVESTCNEQGHTAGSKCTVCHEILVPTEELPLAEHTLYVVPQVESTCLVQGTSSYIKCSVCNVNMSVPEFLDLAECNSDGYVEAAEPTCTLEGHNGYHYCTVCNRAQEEVETVAKLSHELYESEVEVLPTCTEAGATAQQSCLLCGNVIVESVVIPVAGHVEVEIPGKDPTCAEVGYTTAIECERCGETIQDADVIPMIDHTIVITHGVNATCTSTGLTDGSKCSVCGTVIAEQEMIAKLPHNYVPMEDLPVECQNNGKTGGTECSVCGAWGESPTFIEHLGHHYGDFTEPCDRCNGYLGEYQYLDFYSVGSSMVEVVGMGSFSSSTLIMPAQYNYKDVVTICSGAINSSVVETILVGSEITTIELGAFKNCTKLKQVYIPANVINVSNAIFNGCTALTDVYVQFIEGQLPSGWLVNWSLGLPDGCTIHYLPEDAVQYEFTYELNSDEQGYTVTGLSYNNSPVQEFVIPASHDGLPVTAIETRAFEGCSFEKITIPSSITSIGDYAFYNSRYLSQVIFEGEVELGERVFLACNSLKTVNMTSVTKMGQYCFSSTALEVVELGLFLSEIPKGCFDSCELLTSVYCNDYGVTIIDDYAFKYCTNLTNIYLPIGLQHIGLGVFVGCNHLEAIYIPDTVETMGVTKDGNGRGNVFYTTGTLTIKCGADSQPSTWYENWNVSEVDPDTDEVISRYTTNWGVER